MAHWVSSWVKGNAWDWSTCFCQGLGRWRARRALSLWKQHMGCFTTMSTPVVSKPNDQAKLHMRLKLKTRTKPGNRGDRFKYHRRPYRCFFTRGVTPVAQSCRSSSVIYSRVQNTTPHVADRHSRSCAAVPSALVPLVAAESMETKPLPSACDLGGRTASRADASFVRSAAADDIPIRAILDFSVVQHAREL